MYFCHFRIRTVLFFCQFQGGQGFKSRPEMAFFQHPSTPMPPMPGGLYGGTKWPPGGGEVRKKAEHCQKAIFVGFSIVKKFQNIIVKIPRSKSKTFWPKGSFGRGLMLANLRPHYGVLVAHCVEISPPNFYQLKIFKEVNFPQNLKSLAWKMMLPRPWPF